MIKYPERQVLNYYYIISEFYDDFRKYAPKQLLRYVIRGILFSRLYGNFKLSMFFLKKALKINKTYFSLTLAFMFTLYLLPKNIVINLHEKFFKKFANLVKKYLISS